ncbi:SCO4402 family protein [Streptomyces nogalater]|uniref:CdiI immunity protein domain-containing protein n=1 Tax=Streptomyces nogalater TaxID=38314 RepID=A0ABW0WRR2_STRNO
MEFSQVNDVSFPEMRRNVLSAVQALSDEEYQRRVWVDMDYPHEGYYDDFEMNLHILYDDTLVLEDPESAMGTVLRSEEEVKAMAELASAIDLLLDREGTGKTDAEYISSPLWGPVVRSAAVAHAALTR